MSPSYGLVFLEYINWWLLSPESGLLQQVKQTCMNSQPGKNYAPRSSIPKNLFWLVGSDIRSVFSLEGTREI